MPFGIPIVLLPSRLLWDKGIHEFLICAKNIKSKGINARFVIVGPIDTENPESISEVKLKIGRNKNL